MRRVIVASLVLAMIAAGCGGGTGKESVKTRPSSSTASSTTTSSTTTAPITAPSAADNLAAYFDAAEAVHHKLAAAAIKINGRVSKSHISVDQATVDAVAAADPTPAGALIPAGLDPVLLRAVVLLQSELVSRHSAMARVGRLLGTYPTNGLEAKDLLQCLGNGAAPAAKFPADLASAKALAASSPPLIPVPTSSRAAAEVAIRLVDMGLRNQGCDSCGGAVVTDLLPITWGPQPSWAGAPPWDGNIGGIPFRAAYDAKGWHIELNAC
jgi:hypothetical protein